MLKMKSIHRLPKLTVVAVSALVLVACSSDDDSDDVADVTTTEVSYVVPLASANEVPPVIQPGASGEANLTLDSDTGALSGSVSVSGLTGPATMAHIHEAAVGENGPVVIVLEGNDDNSVWSVPADTVLDTAQLQSLLDGNMYVNVHTDANQGGELRGQIVITTEFTVRIDNVSSAETLTTSTGSVAVPLSPGAYVVHRAAANPLLEPRNPASAAIEDVAEDGNPSLFPTTVPGAIVFNTPVGATEPGPIFPGGYYTFSFLASPGDQLSIATMFIQSNDWFYSTTDDNNDSIALFDETGAAISGDISEMFSLWESGTEVDEEPGTGPNQAPRQTGPDTGDEEALGVGSLASRGKSVTLNGDVIQVTITPSN